MQRLIETSVRFSPGTLERLKVIAHLRSLEAGKTVTWNQLVRDVVETHLLGGGQQPHAERSLATEGR